jgi:RNA polymerase sigma factor (sigma-70 family)
VIAAGDVKAAAAGSVGAYERLVNGSRNLVTSIAFATVRDVSSSEEIAQDVFIHAWRGLEKLRSPESFLPWLRQLTRNRANQFLRERHRRPASAEPAALEAAPDARPGLEDALISAEQERRLAAAVDALPEETREVVLLFYREGQSISQAAALLDLSEDAVKKRLSRARDRLRESLNLEMASDAESTRPTERFSAAVLAALPPSASSAGAGVAGGLATLGAVSKLLLGLSGALAGAAMGLMGILAGHRREMKKALDDQEKRELTRVRNFGVAALLVSSTGMAVAILAHRPAFGLLLGYLYVAVILYLYTCRHARILNARWARELAQDPAQARRIRRERSLRWVSAALGVGTALGTLLWLTYELATRWR